MEGSTSGGRSWSVLCYPEKEKDSSCSYKAGHGFSLLVLNQTQWDSYHVKFYLGWQDLTQLHSTNAFCHSPVVCPHPRVQ